MKTINLCVIIGALMLIIACSKEDLSCPNNLVGTWVSTFVGGDFPNVADTLLFTDDFLIKKNSSFNEWEYAVAGDSISFFKDGNTKKYAFSCLSESEMVIHRFYETISIVQTISLYLTKIK